MLANSIIFLVSPPNCFYLDEEYDSSDCYHWGSIHDLLISAADGRCSITTRVRKGGSLLAKHSAIKWATASWDSPGKNKIRGKCFPKAGVTPLLCKFRKCRKLSGQGGAAPLILEIYVVNHQCTLFFPNNSAPLWTGFVFGESNSLGDFKLIFRAIFGLILTKIFLSS